MSRYIIQMPSTIPPRSSSDISDSEMKEIKSAVTKLKGGSN
jgi:hypothetical protein